MNRWPVERTETVFECPWFAVGYDDVETPDGRTERYFWISRPEDAVGIVAVDDGSVVMVEQYRPKLGERFLECPGGHLEGDETYEEAAARELQEETGMTAGDYHHLTTYYPTATTRYRRAVVVAEGLNEGRAHPDDGEYLDCEHVPVEDAIGRATDAPTTGWTLTALVLARNRGYI